MTEQIVDAKINDRWEIKLLEHREEFHRLRPGWEKERIDSCAVEMKPGMTVWDIGSEVGDFTALYHLFVGETGTVIPIEPSPPYWPAIRAHWEANNLPPLKAYFPGFVGHVDALVPELLDERYLTTFVGPDGWPYCSVGEVIPDFGFRHLAQQLHHTPCLTIDTLSDYMDSIPDVIVMDIEGAEWHALQGAYKTLRYHHPIMYVSIHQPIMLDWYDRRLSDILTYMAGLDYDLEYLGQGTEEFWVFK